MTLPDTIGGHSREALIWACSPGFNNENCVTTSMVKAVAFRATRDPAKLAELARAELIRRGVSADKEHHADVVIAHNGSLREPGIDVSIMGAAGREFTLPEFRAALLRVLQLPEGATAADAMKALEVGP